MTALEGSFGPEREGGEGGNKEPSLSKSWKKIERGGEWRITWQEARG